MSYPKIKFKGKKLHQVGCVDCGLGDIWRIYTDKETIVAKCKCCGHIIELKKKNIKESKRQKAIPLRLL